jgi:hypothetical protein
MDFRALCVVILLAACHTDVPMTSSSNELPRISVTTDGGITGRGLGGIVIEGGQVTATLQQKSCTGTLTDAERSKLHSLTLSHDSDEAGHGSPDQIRYTLSAGEHKASWFGENAPKDVAPLFELLWHIRQRVIASC